MIKRENKFAACAVLSIVALICAYLIYYTWSLAFGEVESNIEYGYKVIIRGSVFTSTDGNETQTKFSEPSAAFNGHFQHHRNFHLFNKENCGVSSSGEQDRIINGVPAKILKNPWAVALIYRHNNGTYSVKCAGTLISGNLINFQLTLN